MTLLISNLSCLCDKFWSSKAPDCCFLPLSLDNSSQFEKLSQEKKVGIIYAATGNWFLETIQILGRKVITCIYKRVSLDMALKFVEVKKS